MEFFINPDQALPLIVKCSLYRIVLLHRFEISFKRNMKEDGANAQALM